MPWKEGGFWIPEWPPHPRFLPRVAGFAMLAKLANLAKFAIRSIELELLENSVYLAVRPIPIALDERPAQAPSIDSGLKNAPKS